MPIAASSSATAANTPRSSRAKRRSARDRAMISSIELMLCTGTLGSTLSTTCPAASQKNHRVDGRELAQGNINMRNARRVEAVRLDIAYDADNLHTLDACSK